MQEGRSPHSKETFNAAAFTIQFALSAAVSTKTLRVASLFVIIDRRFHLPKIDMKPASVGVGQEHSEVGPHVFLLMTDIS
jgi:hypothetical protein